MLNTNLPIYKMITEICDEQGIEFGTHSFGYINSLKKDGITKYMVLYKFDLNTVTSAEIAKDKYATYEILKSKNVPIIDHNIIFNPKTRKDFVSDSDIEKAKEIFDKYNKKIVLKANGSSQGKEVFLVTNKDDIEKTVKDIFSRDNDSLSVCPFEEIKNEYRVIILNGKVLFSYKKDRPYVVGDGIKKVSDYLDELKIHEDDCELDLNYIPKMGEKVYLNWKFNLCGGSSPNEIEDLNKKKIIEEIALSAANAINISFTSVDVIENTSGEFSIMEVNGTVCMNKFSQKYPNGYEIAKEIYRKAILAMFEQ